MTSETTRVKAKLAALSLSFDELEAHLEPLFSQSLPESIVDLELIQQAKLQTALPYVVYDLIIIFLKSRGIDPKTHPVFLELDRVREYFQKIENAEDPATRRPEIDKAAASRFIKHAITQAKSPRTPVDTAVPSSSTPNVQVPVKVTSKMKERAQYEEELKKRDAEESEEDGLEVFADGDPVQAGMDVDVSDVKGKAKAVEGEVGVKRRRPAIDPFAGYGDDIPSAGESASKKPKSSEAASPTELPENHTASNTKSKERRSKRHSLAASGPPSAANTPRLGDVSDVPDTAAVEGKSNRSAPVPTPGEAKAKKSKKKSRKFPT